MMIFFNMPFVFFNAVRVTSVYILHIYKHSKYITTTGSIFFIIQGSGGDKPGLDALL